MCGIAGIYNFDNRPIDVSSLKKMTAILSHRGPDNEGYYVNRDIGLGHRRLSTIDLSEAANQPMGNEDGTLWLVFNGCIYNYIELKEHLESKGHAFKSKADTEVILHSYEEYGFDCLNHFNGMFAFALWDDRKKLLFLARDRVGIKPLYYSVKQGNILFASEIKAILESKDFARQPDLDTIYDYLTFQFTLNESTFFKGIKKLMPGHCLVVSKDNVRINQYWDIEVDYLDDSEQNYISSLKELLYDSIRLHLRSDAPVGISLSGGIDSSIVSAIAAEVLKKDIEVFNGRFTEGEDFDESYYARLLSDRLSLKYNEVIPKVDDFSRIFPKLIWHLDEPTAGVGIYGQYFVAREASLYVKVLLGGEGGDELFAGYHRYIRTYLEELFLNSLLKERKSFPRLAQQLFNNVSIKELMTFLSRFSCDFSRRYYLLISLMDHQKAFLAEDFVRKRSRDQFDRFYEIFNQKKGMNLLDKMLYFDFKIYLPSLLQVDDRINMASSVESRLPLLDHRIVELAFSIPQNIKIDGLITKNVLRNVSRGLIPDEIINRKDKAGFNTPFSLWANNSLKAYIKDTLIFGKIFELGILDKERLDKLFCNISKNLYCIWNLLNLNVWYEIYFKQ